MAEDIDTLGRVGAVGSSDFTTAHDSTSPTPRAAPAGATAKGASGGVSAAAAQQPGRQPARQPSSQELQAAVKQVNLHLATVNRVLELHVDAATGLTIATIRNAQTGAVLQQIPSSDSVHLAQMLAAWSPGKNVLVDLIA
jgi:uncharacterized FlaG/YvyC family protein